jgi:hypothetical protein
MQIDEQTAVIVCAGPSLDRLSPVAWSEIQRAGALVSVNGALMAAACRDHGVRFTHLAAMRAGEHMEETVPGFVPCWSSTPAWRLTHDQYRGEVEAETYVCRFLEWSEDPAGGLFGGSTAMAVGNWLHNDWPRDEAAWSDLERIAARAGKAIPRRGYRSFVLLGLDMIPGQGGHAAGAGSHRSGFTTDPGRDGRVRNGWRRFYEAAAARGSRVLNLSPGTGLQTLPHEEPPAGWLL